MIAKNAPMIFATSIVTPECRLDDLAAQFVGLVGGIVLWRRQHKAGQQRQIPAPLLQGVASMRVGVTLATFCLVLTTAPTERTSGIDVGCRDIRDPRACSAMPGCYWPECVYFGPKGPPPGTDLRTYYYCHKKNPSAEASGLPSFRRWARRGFRQVLRWCCADGTTAAAESTVLRCGSQECQGRVASWGKGGHHAFPDRALARVRDASGRRHHNRGAGEREYPGGRRSAGHAAL